MKAALGEHNHEGPGIRQVTSGYMTYVLPDKTVVYAPGDFFFESGDINHTVFNKTDTPMVHVLFEILPVNLNGPSLIRSGIIRTSFACDVGSEVRAWPLRADCPFDP